MKIIAVSFLALFASLVTLANAKPYFCDSTAACCLELTNCCRTVICPVEIEDSVCSESVPTLPNPTNCEEPEKPQDPCETPVVTPKEDCEEEKKPEKECTPPVITPKTDCEEPVKPKDACEPEDPCPPVKRVGTQTEPCPCN
ncbi:hypothetical protein HMI54_008111 [Coelomomyces lativittatus]|nr:hypothetical protein HMI54_008111 [Coelomomyces lativittatus]